MIVKRDFELLVQGHPDDVKAVAARAVLRHLSVSFTGATVAGLDSITIRGGEMFDLAATALSDHLINGTELPE